MRRKTGKSVAGGLRVPSIFPSIFRGPRHILRPDILSATFALLPRFFLSPGSRFFSYISAWHLTVGMQFA